MAPTRPGKTRLPLCGSPAANVRRETSCVHARPTQKMAATSSSSSREEAHRYVSQSTASLLDREKKGASPPRQPRNSSNRTGGDNSEREGEGGACTPYREIETLSFSSSLPSAKPGLGFALLPKQKELKQLKKITELRRTTHSTTAGSLVFPRF